MANYVTYRLLKEPYTNIHFAAEKPHIVVTYAAPHVGAEIQGKLGKSFRAKFHKLAHQKSSQFGLYSMETVGTDGRHDSVATIWRDSLKRVADNIPAPLPVDFHRIGVPIDYQTDKVDKVTRGNSITIFDKEAWTGGDNDRGLHDSKLYLKSVIANNQTTLPPPMGWVEFYNKGGLYAAKYNVTYTSGGQQRTLDTGDMTVGMIQFYPLPGDATNVVVKGSWGVSGIGHKEFFSRRCKGPPNRTFETTGTAISPSWKHDGKGRNYTFAVRTRSNRNFQIPPDRFGTDADLSIEIVGPAGKTEPVVVNPLINKASAFENDTIDNFTIQGEDEVGQPSALILTLRRVVDKDAWYPEWIDVTPEGGQKVRFNINRYIEDDGRPQTINR